MGSGKRFSIWYARSLGLGFSIACFPFTLTFNLQILLWGMSFGLGKGYDEKEEK